MALQARLSDWGFGARARAVPHTVSENATFLVEVDAAPVAVLRVHRPGYHAANEIRSELAWIAALRDADAVVTAAPLGLGATAPGCVDVAGVRLDVSAFSFLAGRAPDARLEPAFERLGDITARLHVQARGWERPAWFRRKRWDWAATLGEAPIWGDWRAAPDLDGAGRALIELAVRRLAGRLAAYGTGPDRFGLIHADLRLANLLADGDRLAVIDFDDCGFGWFVYDFAASVSFMEDEPAVASLAAAWCAGYARVRPLAPEDRAMLPDFVLLRRLMLLAWITSRAGSDTADAFRPGFAAGTMGLVHAYLRAI